MHVEFLRGGRPSDSFSSLWAAFTLTVHINALYNESIGEGGGMTARLRLNAPWLRNCVRQDCDISHSE